MTWSDLKKMIKKKMEAEEISAYRLSVITRIPRSTLSMYFNDKREPHINNVLKILDALGIEIK